MKFSIIIPVFNQAEYLPDAIESALNQTVKPHEVIVINDGSTDASLSVAQKFGVKIVSQVNKGLPSARNTGIMNATGDYVLPLDADDILLENCIQRMTETAEKDSPDIIAPSFKMFGTANHEVILNKIPSIEEFKEANRLGYFSAIKRSVLLERGGYNPKMVWGYEDYDLWMDILKRGHTLCMLSDVLVLYRTKEKSMLTEANKHRGALNDQMRLNHPEIYP